MDQSNQIMWHQCFPPLDAEPQRDLFKTGPKSFRIKQTQHLSQVLLLQCEAVGRSITEERRTKGCAPRLMGGCSEDSTDKVNAVISNSAERCEQRKLILTLIYSTDLWLTSISTQYSSPNIPLTLTRTNHLQLEENSFGLWEEEDEVSPCVDGGTDLWLVIGG